MIDEDIKELKKEFERIKRMGLIKVMRKGSGGCGYTFETLLGKKEDQECKPDFKSIEIKCKYGFAKNHLGLFTCAPKRNGMSVVNYMYENYAYENIENAQASKMFALKIFSHYTINKNGFTFRLGVNDIDEKVYLKAYLNDEFLENICSWDFQVLDEKLLTKLSTLALVDCYPYKRDNEDYVKYCKITFYRLKSFEKFLNLIKNDTICVQTYLYERTDEPGNKVVETHGFQFQIRKENIERLYDKITF